jgi:hypothetical protein
MTMDTPASIMLRSTTPVPADVLAKLGATVASTAERLQAGWPGMPQGAAEHVARLDELGLQLQALARVLSGRAPAAPEAVDLGVAVLQARAEWHGELQRHGVEMTGPRQGWVVQGSPGVLKQLLDLAIRHSVQLARRIHVELLPHPQAGHVALSLTVHGEGDELFALGPGVDDDLHWELLELLARHTGVMALRSVQAHAVVLTLGFPTSMDPGQRLPEASVPALPAHRDAPAWSFVPSEGTPGRTPPQTEPARASSAGGAQVLLLEPHEPTRRLALRLMAAAGMVATTAVPTVAQARAAIDHSLPECLITGISVADPSVAPLLADLRARQPSLRVVELADDDPGCLTLLPAGDAPRRISRANIEHELMPALAHELVEP